MKIAAQELPNDALDELAHLPLDDALDALRHIKRRKLLFALLDHNTEGGSPGMLVDSEEEAGPVEERVEMIHLHLPKLADYGFIGWDRDAHEVVQGPEFDEIEPLLELLADSEDELPRRLGVIDYHCRNQTMNHSHDVGPGRSNGASMHRGQNTPSSSGLSMGCTDPPKPVSDVVKSRPGAMGG